MERKWFSVDSIPVSGSFHSTGVINLVRARTLSITARITCGSSIDANTTVYLYYSPDGNNWDTEAYTSFEVTYSAGATVQRTMIIDVPEHGYMKIKITNGSSADVLSPIDVWYSLQSWQPDKPSKGDISTQTMRD